jgi:S-adenosylmethionine hydrolase
MRQAIDRGYRESGGQGSALGRIEPLVRCDSFSVSNVNFLVRLLAENASPGTILMAIVNPISIRTERILGVTETGVSFEGTNTGAFGWLTADMGCVYCVELHDPGFVPFGGKFVHAPAVGRFLAGQSLEDLGSPFPTAGIRGGRPAAFEVVHIDNFGNAKLFAVPQGLGPLTVGEALTVTLPDNAKIDARYAIRMMDGADGTWCVYPGSSLGLLEVGQVRGRGLLDRTVRPGDIMRISRCPTFD